MNLLADQLPPTIIKDELLEVQSLLNEVAKVLHFPLNNLVHTQIERAEPFVRATVVLATACKDDVADSAPSELLRSQRIYLASALEMLYIALNVHKSLLNFPVGDLSTNGVMVRTEKRPNAEQEVEHAELAQTDKLVMGSTILAGDYCFSRAAAMATKTGDPLIVDTFSGALKRVSEEHLRSIFDSSAFAPNEDETLLLAGIRTSSQLIQASEPAEATLTSLCRQLVQTLSSQDNNGDPLLNTLGTKPSMLSEIQIARWRELVQWLVIES